MARRGSGRGAVAVAACLLLLGSTGCGTRRHVPLASGSIGYSAWSPDGRRIAWGEGIRGAPRQRIWIAAADMSHAHAVTPPLDSLGEIAWLPRGRLLYWLNSRFFVLRPGGGSVQISPFAGDGFALDGRGTRIVTGGPACSTGCNGGAFVLDVDGSVVRRISPNTQATNPTFSPDGRRIAFARTLCDATGRCDRPVGIWVGSVASGRLRQLTQRGCCPSWSPDGTRIAYLETDFSRPPPAWSLRVVASRGGRSAHLLRGLGSTIGVPAWAPDSQRIAFVGGRTERLLIVGLRTRRVRAVHGIGGALPTVFAWSPDSTKLLVAARGSEAGCASLWLVRADGAGARLLRRC